MDDPARMPGARRRLLDAAVDHALARGIADQSLRAIAEAIGTSHRMLIHHFGSKEALLVAVIKAVEAREQQALADLRADPDATPDAVMRRFWNELRSPALHAQERLFFEVYGQALQGRAWAVPLLDGVVDDWVGPVRSLLEARGASPLTAEADARLSVAVVRGLLLDLLATGDEAGVDAAMARFGDLLRSAEPSGDVGSVQAPMGEAPEPGTSQPGRRRRWHDVTVQPFEHVVADHGPTVMRVCRALLGPVEADDAWSETFVSALRAYPRLRPDSDVRAWLVTIAHRRAIDQLRRTARAPRPTAALPETPSAEPPPPEGDGLRAAVQALPFKQRAAVAYRYLADLSYAEIAQLLACSEAAARRNAADGIASLRTRYPNGPREG